MAMSLEDLLAKEGFKGRKLKTISRASSEIVSSKIPIYPTRDEHKLGGASTRVRKTERAYSDANRYALNVESPLTDRAKGRRSVDAVRRDKNVRRSTSIGYSSKQSSISEIVEFKEDVERVKNGVQDKSRHKDLYLNSPSANFQKNLKQHISSSIKSSTSTQNKGGSHNSKVHGSVNINQSGSVMALDELAIKAIISITSAHTKSFIKDQDFRASLHQSCLSVLNLTNHFSESKVICNLKEAIETVERATEENADARSLKKAAFQLSVITGLSADDLKDGLTSGIPNSLLSACGHLYLSVIYQVQKKERIAAKHLLQVFIDSPLSARTMLVADLWESLFHPHLLHLDEWYNQEVDFLMDDSRNSRKLKHLKKLYDEILDFGTHQFALYYKDWLTDGVETPIVPTIHVPSVSYKEFQQGGSSGNSVDFSTPANAFSPLMGRKDKMTVTHSLKEKEYRDLHIKQYGESHQDGLVAQEALELHRANAFGKFKNTILQQEGQMSTKMLQPLPISKVNELTLKMLAKSVFKLQQDESSTAAINDAHPQSETTAITGERGHFIYDIPQDYICPLTKVIFKDPVTLETGQTYERVAILEWFKKGNKSCPVTGEILDHHNVPRTNFILNRVINIWKAEHSRNILASACQVAGISCEQKFKDEEAIFILEQLLTVFGEEEDKRLVKQLIAFGGLYFLIKRFEYGDLDEKTRVAGLLLCCFRSDSSCRINVTKSIEKQCLLELLHCKGVKSIANAVLLLFELICLNRRKDVQIFLDGLQKESIMSSMNILVVFLDSCSPEQRPLVAVLLLHLDLMVNQQKYSKYREKAVDTITSALDTSLYDEKVRATCCRALLILGGRISFCGKVMTEDWILKKTGFLDGPELEVQEDEVPIKDNIFPMHEYKEEEVAVNDWLMMLSASLLGDGNKSFLDSVSRSLNSEHRDMKRVCLTTMAWLSSTLTSLLNYESQLSAFSSAIYQLKETLKDGEWVEHRILAAMSLLNFTKIPECRDLLMTIADEIIVPLRDLCEATLMAKELYALISHKQNIKKVNALDSYMKLTPVL